MKYMGHKGRILSSIRTHIASLEKTAKTLGDPFCGSAVVAWDLAEQFKKPVIAGDLQSFASARAEAILCRTRPITSLNFLEDWRERAVQLVLSATDKLRIPRIQGAKASHDLNEIRNDVIRARDYVKNTLSKKLSKTKQAWPITSAYAGYYFSIEQSLIFDSLRASLPTDPELRAVSLAALISAASKCSASPGHTAQPLGITNSSLPHVIDAWGRDPFHYVLDEVKNLAPRHAQVLGKTITGSWENLIASLNEGDLAFCDPPYSGVHYSRFYHVLETLSRGLSVEVTGSGRNPPFSERPSSEFSRKSKARNELKRLMQTSSTRGVNLVITFPTAWQSNGLRAADFTRLANQFYPKVEQEDVCSMFSSLGGSGHNGTRPAQRARTERIICCSH